MFVADDAFGSTEYRPEAAERWALDLDRILRSMDESHWLLWTSRPTPLKAALRRIHREHGVERFPAPAHVQVDAASLEIAEKTLDPLPARARCSPAVSCSASRPGAWLANRQPRPFHAGAHPTARRHSPSTRTRRRVRPGRGRRHGGRADPRTHPGDGRLVPSPRARAPRRPDRHARYDLRLRPRARADVVRSPAPPRGSSTRSHGRPLDRLTDHFVRIVEPSRVAWVHPSWRDVVIDELAGDTDARRAFLRDCSVEGVLLALSTGGGVSGERSLPLLIDDADWDLVGDRATAFVSDLDDPTIVRLITAISEAHAVASERETAELDALAGSVLERLARRWNAAHAVIPVGVLAVWFELASRLRQRPPEPELGPTWVEHLPTKRVDISDRSELTRVDDWIALAALIGEHTPQMLAAFGFPERQAEILQVLIFDAGRCVGAPSPPPFRDLLVAVLRRLTDLAPEDVVGAAITATRLARMSGEAQFEPSRHPPRGISEELRAVLDAPPSRHVSEEQFVARVLRDL